MERLARSAQHLVQAAPTATDGTIGGGTDFGGVEFFTLEEVGAPDPDAGLRITMLPGLPGLWAEALKNLCDVKGVPYKRVIHPYGDRDAQAFLYELTAQRSLPTMLYNDEPPRSALIEQIQLAEKLAAPGAPLLIPATAQVRNTPSWPRSWANFSLFCLYSYRNARANSHPLGQPNTLAR